MFLSPAHRVAVCFAVPALLRPTCSQIYSAVSMYGTVRDKLHCFVEEDMFQTWPREDLERWSSRKRFQRSWL